MTTTARTKRARRPSRAERIVSTIRYFISSGDLTALIIVTAMLLTPPLALNRAEWPLEMRVIIPVTIISVAFGVVLARSQFNELMALVVGITYGFCAVLLATAISLGGGLGAGVYDVFVRTTQWMVDAITGGINQDDMVFTLLVATLFWFLGYNAAWHTFRMDRVWRVILPPGLILASNTIFYTGEHNLDLYTVMFLFLALLLIVRSNLDAREWDWYTNGIKAPRHIRQQFLRVGATLAVFTLFLGWSIPSGNLQERLDRFQEFLQSDPLVQMSEFWNRLFSPIEAQGPTTADYYGGDSLDLGGAIRLGEQTVFLAEAPTNHRYYWRSRVFDTYEGGRWTPAADTRLTDTNAPLNIVNEPSNARVPVEQEFTIALNGSRIIYTAPQPLQVDLPTRSDLFYVGDEGDPNRVMSLSVIRPTQVLRRGDSYTATSLMSTATAHDLRGAGTTYPEWVSRLYLYVSPSVTQRTVDLAWQTVAGAVTPYDQAKAIETYLRTNIIYNETIPRPPDGQDPVDWVLFDYRQGYCNYYASAMIVMLRTIGIPARMAAGFAQGRYDPALGAFVVTERDAHTWVEAYFPGYGWIEFEPTAAQLPIEREGDNAVSEQLIAPPVVTPTFTPSPTPQPTATPNATPTPPDDQGQENPPELPTWTPTITPTFTPSPTTTPVIVPTQPAPINPAPRNPLETILPALGMLLLGLLLLMLLLALAVFIYWWWEWRGMRGLSPVARAYARLERYVRLIGIQLRRQETPEERRQQILKTLPQAERPVTAITRLYTSERYGPSDRHPAENQRRTGIVDEAWTHTRSSILRRWLNRFVPWRRNR